jgi:hypothetical protein
MVAKADAAVSEGQMCNEERKLGELDVSIGDMLK